MLSLGPFTPAHASRRWTSMLTQAGRRKPEKAEGEAAKLPAIRTVLPASTSAPAKRTSTEILPLATSTQLPVSTPSEEDFDSQGTQIDIEEIPLVVDEDEQDPDKTIEFDGSTFDAFVKPLPPKKK